MSEKREMLNDKELDNVNGGMCDVMQPRMLEKNMVGGFGNEDQTTILPGEGLGDPETLEMKRPNGFIGFFRTLLPFIANRGNRNGGRL